MKNLNYIEWCSKVSIILLNATMIAFLITHLLYGVWNLFLIFITLLCIGAIYYYERKRKELIK